MQKFGHDRDELQRSVRRIDGAFKAELKSERILKDTGAVLSIYNHVGGADERVHKKLHIIDEKVGPREITRMSKVVDILSGSRQFTRYFFEHEA